MGGCSPQHSAVELVCVAMCACGVCTTGMTEGFWQNEVTLFFQVNVRVGILSENYVSMGLHSPENDKYIIFNIGSHGQLKEEKHDIYLLPKNKNVSLKTA